ncbi:MAG TPA: 2-dehydropantoate 2-reductase [Homoserinimonas sp.]|nr:2-dehydropantoate 2-reductase [Homoserinimonas sp.]
MDIAVIGAGAIGGTIASLLDRAGHEVEITARGAHLDAISRNGIRLSGAWGDHVATVAAGERLSRKPELVVLATKAMDAPGAARDNAAFLDGVPLVVVQNGLGGLEETARAAPNSPVVGALCLIAASLTAPGEIVVTTAASTWLGMADPAAPGDAARFAAQVLGEAVPCEVVQNFEGARWTKLIINQVNALPAITGLTVQEVIDDPALRRLLTASMQEAARVGLASGVRFEEVNQVTHDALVRLAGSSPEQGDFLALQLRAYLGDVPNPGSTLQSIRRGQASEIDYLNGAIVSGGLAAGVPTPVNARLLELVHQVERTGRFLEPGEVVAAL